MTRNSAFLGKMEDLVKQVVTYSNIPTYLIDSKIETQVNAYGENVNIPVVRVVSFFEDTISKVTNLLNSEFDIRIIKDEHATPDSFTSSGLTFQAALKSNRLDLPEYKILGPHRFEIRVSSILQDVYTAMQKGLSNGSPSLPDNVKRDFYRVGAFLEMADIEFVKIRDNAGNTGRNHTAAMPDLPQITREPQVVMAQPVAAPVTPVAPAPMPAPVPVPVVEMPAPVVEAPVPAPVVEKRVAAPVMSAVTEAVNKIDAMDMSVDSFNALAVGINNIENKNGLEEKYLDIFTPPVAAPVEEPVAEVAPVEAPKPAPEAVALNIDKIDTFNMNVNGFADRFADMPQAAPVVAAVTNTLDENAQMTEESLTEFVRTSYLIKEVDSSIAERAGAKINDDIDIEGDVDRLRFLKVFNIRQLVDKITDNKDDIIAFAEKWIGKDNGGSFDSGICLFYLEYLIVGMKNDPAFAVEYVLKFISDNDYSARYIIPTYNSIRQTAEPSNSYAHLTLK
jgi:hypothetical protein